MTLNIKSWVADRISRRIWLIYFFSFIVVKVIISAYLIFLWTVYIYPLEYSIVDIKMSYIVGIILILAIFRYWEKFIKRKLHFILIGDNKKI